MRRNCSKCGRWLYACLHFYAAERHPDGSVKRIGSHCHFCVREATRIRAGRKRRGFRYEARKPAMTPEQRNARRRRRHNYNMTLRRNGTMAIPLRPLSELLRMEVARTSHASVERRTGLNESAVRRLAAGVWLHKGRWQKQLDISVDRADSILHGLGYDLFEVYYHDHPKLDMSPPRRLKRRKPKGSQAKRNAMTAHLKPHQFTPRSD